MKESEKVIKRDLRLNTSNKISIYN